MNRRKPKPPETPPTAAEYIDQHSTETVVDMGAGSAPADDRAADGSRVLAQVSHNLKTGEVKDARSKPLSEAAFETTNARRVFSAGTPTDIELTWEEKVDAMKQAHLMYRTEPMFRGLVDAMVYYVIGSGIKFKARDENPKVQEHINKFWAANKMDGRDAEIVRRFFKYGEVPLRYYNTDAAGKPAQVPRVRFIPFWRLTDIVKDPEDAETILELRIEVPEPSDAPEKGANRRAAYIKTKSITLPPSEFQYITDSPAEEERAEPKFLPVMKTIRHYADWIHNRVVINRFRTAFVLFKKVKGGTPGNVSSVDTSTSRATATGTKGLPQNRVPKPGTMVTHNENIEYDWKAPEVDAADVSFDGTAIRQFVAMGAQVPEFILGNIASGNYATTFVAENPFVRQVEYYQDFFSSVFREVFKRVIEQGMATGALEKNSTETIVAESGPFMRRVGKILKAFGLKEVDANGYPVSKKAVPTSVEVDIQWPPILHKDQLDEASAAQIDQSMGLVSTETLRAKRGYDHEVETPRLEKEEQLAHDTADLRRQADLAADPEAEPPTGPAAAA